MANAKFYGDMWSSKEVASYLKISVQTVAKYVRMGLLSATDISKGTGRPIYGFREEDVVDFTQRLKKSSHSGHVCYEPPTKTTKKEVIKERRKCSIIEKPNKYKEEIIRLKQEVRALSEELFEVCVRLDELTN